MCLIKLSDTKLSETNKQRYRLCFSKSLLYFYLLFRLQLWVFCSNTRLAAWKNGCFKPRHRWFFCCVPKPDIFKPKYGLKFQCICEIIKCTYSMVCRSVQCQHFSDDWIDTIVSKLSLLFFLVCERTEYSSASEQGAAAIRWRENRADRERDQE